MLKYVSASDYSALKNLCEETPVELIDARVQLAGSLRALINVFSSAKANENQLKECRKTIIHLTSILREADSLPGYTRVLEGRLTGLGPNGELGPFTGEMHVYSSGIKLDVSGTEDQKLVTGHVTYGAAFEGAPGLVHGGFIVATFDEILGLVQAGKQRMTASLEVSYRAPAPLHVPLVYKSWIEKVDGRKAYVCGHLLHNDVICAEAKALFIQPRDTSAA
ncbi:MAG: PaaI family thioesterase, partial [Novosphingobium sp.]